MSAKFTPGPWEWRPNKHGEMRLYAADGAVVLAIDDQSSETKQDAHIDPRSNEDARLIAAAPEMYQEIEKQIEWLRHVRPQVVAPESVLLGLDQAIKYLSDALAKAGGQ